MCETGPKHTALSLPESRTGGQAANGGGGVGSASSGSLRPRRSRSRARHAERPDSERGHDRYDFEPFVDRGERRRKAGGSS